jgi:hypothetical protein
MLTTLQIVQFCIYGVVVLSHLALTTQNLSVQLISESGHRVGSLVSFSYSYTHACKGDLWILAVSAFVNITILALFMNFFNKSYSQPPTLAASKKSKRK